MSGMGSDLGLTNPAVVAAFVSALRQQGVIALLMFALLALAWISVRGLAPGAGRAELMAGMPAASAAATGLACAAPSDRACATAASAPPSPSVSPRIETRVVSFQRLIIWLTSAGITVWS